MSSAGMRPQPADWIDPNDEAKFVTPNKPSRHVILTVEFMDRSISKFQLDWDAGGDWSYYPQNPEEGLINRLVIRPRGKGLPRTEIPLTNVRIVGVEAITDDD